MENNITPGVEQVLPERLFLLRKFPFASVHKFFFAIRPLTVSHIQLYVNGWNKFNIPDHPTLKCLNTITMEQNITYIIKLSGFRQKHKISYWFADIFSSTSVAATGFLM